MSAIRTQGSHTYVFMVAGTVTRKAILRHVQRGWWIIEVYFLNGSNAEGITRYTQDYALNATNEREAISAAKMAIEGVSQQAKQSRLAGFLERKISC